MTLKRLEFVLTIAALLCLLIPGAAQAQSETPKLEWSAHYSALYLSDFETWSQGVGSRISYNLDRHVALEGEINFFFPRGTAPLITPTTFLLGERITQGLFGVKAGARWGKFGLFGKLRPGLINFNEGRCQGVLFNGSCFGGLAPGAICRDANGNVGVCAQSLRGGTKFALDLGEVIEFYPTRRFVLRVDLGDTVIRNSQSGRTSHNFQIGAGIGVRF